MHVTQPRNKTPKPIVSHFRLLEEFKLSLVCVGQEVIRFVSDHRRMKILQLGGMQQYREAIKMSSMGRVGHHIACISGTKIEIYKYVVSQLYNELWKRRRTYMRLNRLFMNCKMVNCGTKI